MSRSEESHAKGWLLVSPAAGGLAVLIGALVLTGWATGVDALTRIRPRFIAMLPNTAVGVIAAGLAILLLQRPTTPRVRGARGLALFVMALGTAAS